MSTIAVVVDHVVVSAISVVLADIVVQLALYTWLALF